jgi:conjugal transfer/entry exclusion protein
MTILMTQTHKQKAVANQINQIRNAIKMLQKMTQSGLYVDAHQKRVLECIAAEELAPLSW